MPDIIKVIDSHTGGEPTRIVIEGGPDLGHGPFANRVEQFRQHHDHLRRAIITEPRGSDVMVGGLLVPPTQAEYSAGIIFFNNHDYLGMCGHGTIGLMSTLKHLGRIEDGSHLIETPVGVVACRMEHHTSTLENVPSYRLAANVTLEVPGIGTVVGDIAWGGNWFFLVKNGNYDLTASNVSELTRVTLAIRTALSDQGITGSSRQWIDHVELFGPAHDPDNDSRNFVLCPGGAYDRSPCGTGTSAKVACLAADGKLQPGQVWRQESIIGSVFTATYRQSNDPSSESVVPSITGSAFVCGETDLILNPNDPFCMGIPS
ncbi:MAG: proline racemase family protein [Planctomycetota bacterium]